LIFGLLVFAAAIVLRLAQLDAGPTYDELYHLMAAQSWIETGTFAIADGAYTRTPIYTTLTAHVLELTGSDTLFGARWPNVIFGSLLVLLAVLWTYRIAGRTAAIVISLLLVLWPTGIYVSQYARFYALHGLLFFAGALSVYAVFLPDQGAWRRALLAVLSGLFFWAALQFQLTTLVGICCLALWVFGFVIVPILWRHPRRVFIFSALAIVGTLTCLLVLGSGILNEYWTHYTFSPWPVDRTYYNRALRDTFPLLWPLTPFLAIAALRATPRPAGFCLVISFAGLVVHTFAGNHNLRYIYYLSPFLFALWAMGVQAVFPTVLSTSQAALRHILGPRASAWMVNGILVVAFLFAIGANGAVPRSVAYALGGAHMPFNPHFDFGDTKERLAELRRDGVVVVAENDLFAIRFLGGLDITFNRNQLPGMKEFDVDPRTGKRIVWTTEALQKIIRCNEKGVFVAVRGWLPGIGYPAFMDSFSEPEILFRVEKNGHMYLYQWETRPLTASDAAACGAALLS